MNRRLFMLTAAACLAAVSLVPGPNGLAAETPFETDVRGAPPADAPVVKPWRVIAVDPEYGGKWVLVGDVDGDGQIDIVSAQNYNKDDDHFTSAAVAQRLDGSVLWRWGDPKLGRRTLHHDVACQIHDLDGDGANEVIVAADRELLVLDGKTGKPRSSFAIPENASDCVVFADLSGQGRAGEILVKNRYEQIWAYSADGRLLWTVRLPGGYRTAHQPLPVDLDGDGRDEILAGYAALNADGTVRWVFEATPGEKNGGHADCWRAVRLAKKPEDTRLVLTMCGGNVLAMTDGNGKLVWKETGKHYESVDVGEVRPEVPGLECVVDVDHLTGAEHPLCVFDERGSLLGQIITDGTRIHMLADFDGDGIDEIGSALARGLFDGHGRRKATFEIGAGERAYLIASGDVTGDGRDDVLLVTNDRSSAEKVYLYRNTSPGAGVSRPPSGSGRNFALY